MPPRAPPRAAPYVLPCAVAVPLTAVSVFGATFVGLALRTEHAHPHTHEERFLWQSNLYLNLILVYFSLEAASPLVHLAVGRLRSTVLDVGLFCDYVALWSVAVAMLLPIELYLDAGDLSLPRPRVVVLYAALGLAIALRSAAFVLLAKRLVARA